MKRMPFAATLPPHEMMEQTERELPEPIFAPDDCPRHSLFVPLHYEKKYAYPLLVWLHSAGDNERQLKRIMPQMSLRNYVAVAPRGTTIDPGSDGRAFCWRQTVGDVLDGQAMLAATIESVQSRYNIHAERVFIGGFADGGTMALRLALRMPQLCAGVFSIGGAMPAMHAPLVNIERARQLPVLLMHGNTSKDYAPRQVCNDLRLLHAAGMSVAVRQYPAGDELTTRMLLDVDSWIMERVTGVPSHADQPACNLGEWN